MTPQAPCLSLRMRPMTATFAYMLFLAFSIGIATAAQSPTNGSLGTVVGPIQASLVSFSGALIILSVICFFTGTGDITKMFDVPVWMWAGGLYGAFVVCTLSACTQNLGVALSLTLIMLGQLMGGMLVDTFGLMDSPALEISPLRAAGCVVILVGIALVYKDRLNDQASEETASPARSLLLQTVLVFCAGLASAFQAPTNTGLGTATGTIEACVISFAGGWIALVIATLITGKGHFRSLKGVKAWQLTGGIYGAYGVPALVTATPVLGVSLAMGGSMAGQIIGGMIVDSLGAFRVKKRQMNPLRIAGAIVLLAGVLIVSAGTN